MLQILLRLRLAALCLGVIASVLRHHRRILDRVAMVDGALVEGLGVILGASTLVIEGRTAPTVIHQSLSSFCLACLTLFGLGLIQSR